MSQGNRAMQCVLPTTNDSSIIIYLFIYIHCLKANENENWYMIGLPRVVYSAPIPPIRNRLVMWCWSLHIEREESLS